MTNEELDKIHQRNIALFRETEQYIRDGNASLSAEDMSKAIFIDEDEVRDIVKNRPENIIPSEGKTFYNVIDSGTVGAVISLQGHCHKDILFLNFASSKHPGGGVRGGARAQEETVCRQTTLLTSLESEAAAAYYKKHRKLNSNLATDAMLLSPRVQVLRNENYEWIGDSYNGPVIVGALTCAAPHLFRNGKETEEELKELYYQRILGMLCVAIKYGYRNLVLGAWGCGAFHNDPELVADAFCRALLTVRNVYCGGKDPFEIVFFAIPGNGTKNYQAFKHRVEKMEEELIQQEKALLEEILESDNPMINDWKSLEDAIAEWAISDHTDDMPVIKELLEGLKRDQGIIVPIAVQDSSDNNRTATEADGKETVDPEAGLPISLQRLDAGDGKFWFAGFTGMSEVEKGAETSAAEFSLSSIIKITSEEPEAVGFVINPWGESFSVTSELANALLENARPLTQDEIDLNVGAEAYSAGEYETAMMLFEESAKAGNVTALSNLGYCYYYGRSIPADKEKARQCWEKAAALGNVNAIYKLGDMYRNGDLPEDIVFSTALYKRAFSIAVQEKNGYSYPDACLRILKYCMDAELPDLYRDIAQDAVNGFQTRVEAGDRFADPLLKEALEIQKKLMR